MQGQAARHEEGAPQHGGEGAQQHLLAAHPVRQDAAGRPQQRGQGREPGGSEARVELGRPRQQLVRELLRQEHRQKQPHRHQPAERQEVVQAKHPGHLRPQRLQQLPERRGGARRPSRASIQKAASHKKASTAENPKPQ